MSICPAALIRSVLLCGFFAMNPAAGSASIFTVGSDGACTHGDLQGALLASLFNGPDYDTIRLAGNVSYEGEYLIDNQSVGIVGGFDHCADTTPFGRTTIDRAFDERNFVVSGTVNPGRLIELYNLNIVFTGSASAMQPEGGAIHLSDGHLLVLDNTSVSNGYGVDGGGIFVDGSSLVLRSQSSVINNDAIADGGGIACANSGLVGLSSATIALNEAFNGGGVSLVTGCVLNHGAGGGLEGIYQNTATSSGGGIAATTGSTVNVFGSTSHPAFVGDNQAYRGGGIYLVLRDTVAFITDSVITGNAASNSGGGIVVSTGASLIMSRTLGANCHHGTRCSELSNNSSGGLSRGGGVEVLGANAAILQTFVEGNTADVGAVGYIDDGYLYLEGNVLAGNTGEALVKVEGAGGTLEAAYLTVGDNTSPLGPMSFVDDEGSGDIRVLSSIVWDPDNLMVVWGNLGTGTHQWDCLVVESLLGLGSGTFITVADPLYANPAAGDYSLLPLSPAIDYCDDFWTPGAGGDVLGGVRGWDDPFVANFPLGPFDLGALEAGPFFSDGFESGDVSAWSQAFP